MFKKPGYKTTRYDMKLIFSGHGFSELERDAAPVEKILLEQGINPLDVIVSRNGKMIPGDAIVEADDEILIIRISHGG